MAEVDRRVQQTYASAKGQPVAHLDPNTMAELDVERGDVVSLEGDRKTAVRVERLEERDWETETIRIDEFTRRNAGVRPTESVSIESIEPAAATSLTVRPETARCCPMGPSHVGTIRNDLLDDVVFPGDSRWVMVAQHQNFGVVVGSWRPVRVVAAAPDGPVRLVGDTDVTLESAIDDVSDGSTAADVNSWAALRETVFERDGHTCRNCGLPGDGDQETLEAHFVVSPAHGGVVTEDNLVALCPECHAAAHESVTTPSI